MSVKLEPKQEATYMVMMMKSGLCDKISDEKELIEASKFCAWQCVDEIIINSDGKDLSFWKTVKKEIDKL